jgi:hypothetical protein
MRRKAVVIGLMLAIVAGGVCGWKFLHRKSPRRANVMEFESDMTEALLRGIFSELDSGKPPVYFVAFGEARTEPSYAFIARFANHRPPVRSFISSVSTPSGMVLETSTGRVGVIIQIVSFKQYIPGTFDVLVVLSNQPAGRDRFTYRIFNAGGEWRVKSRKPA